LREIAYLQGHHYQNVGEGLWEYIGQIYLRALDPTRVSSYQPALDLQFPFPLPDLVFSVLVLVFRGLRGFPGFFTLRSLLILLAFTYYDLVMKIPAPVVM
jgi:hypothetical protein